MEKKITIESKLYPYTVEFVDDFQTSLKEIRENVTYVIDKNVYTLYENKLSFIDEENIFFIDAVEEEKNMDTVLKLIDFWKEKGVKKNWKAICIGGGISQDITTFASNIFLRNIEWYLFPTTLLSMCDSCIGGKCGINRGQYKNQLGVFYPPKKIFIDKTFLTTLSQNDYINGWGELLKFSITSDAGFYKDLEEEECYIPCANIDEYIYRGLQVKKYIIEQDEFEGDLRRVLNYGHTFGHALEAYTHNRIAHGTAVIWGIDVVNYIAVKENIFPKEEYLQIKALICKEFLKDEMIVKEPNQLFQILSTDKKVKNNTIYLAIPNAIGNLQIYPMELDEKLENYFMEYLEETHEYYCH